MSSLLKLLIVFALSSVKFLLAPPLSFGMGLNFIQTLISTSAGGIMGVFVFFFMSRWLIRYYEKHFSGMVHKKVHAIAGKFDVKHLAERHFPTTKKIFTFNNKLFVRIRRTYGLIGLIILTPVLLSIPLGTFLITRFYPDRRHLVLYLSASVVFWSLLMSSAIAIF